VATDGDFNVGPSSQDELVALIKKKRSTGIYLTILGVGKGNLNDALMEQTANNGNGTYEYIDNFDQANKIFNLEYGKFYSVAADVKVQVEFNTNAVESYRLIGYENRLMENTDFDDDERDAGEIGSNQTITALYELILKNSEEGHLATVGLKYKTNEEGNVKEINKEVFNNKNDFWEASENMRFVAAVTAFSLKLRNSTYQGNVSYDQILDWANASNHFDPNGYRNGFVEVVGEYIKMKGIDE